MPEPPQAEQCVAAATGVSLSNFLLMVVPFAAGGKTFCVRPTKPCAFFFEDLPEASDPKQSPEVVHFQIAPVVGEEFIPPLDSLANGKPNKSVEVNGRGVLC